ncbi:hypothetical protein KJ865_03490, partial [Myxococcota bacterium]|nr:hypothetical protein [Myxococcota bacterium]
LGHKQCKPASKSEIVGEVDVQQFHFFRILADGTIPMLLGCCQPKVLQNACHILTVSYPHRKPNIFSIIKSTGKRVFYFINGGATQRR